MRIAEILSEGMSALDVGAGPGAVMRLMADRVGPQGRVTGIEIDANTAHDSHQLAIDTGGGGAGYGVLQIAPRHRRRHRGDLRGPDQRRVGHQTHAQGPFEGETTQRVAGVERTGMPTHGVGHRGERLDRRPVAVQHLERLTVVSTDTHLQACLTGVGVVDHTTHLETFDLKGRTRKVLQFLSRQLEEQV